MPTAKTPARDQWSLSEVLALRRQVQVLNKNLEGVRRLTGLPACSGICSLAWVSPQSLACCTTTGIFFWDFALQNSGPIALDVNPKQRFACAAISPGLDTFAAGCVDKLVC